MDESGGFDVGWSYIIAIAGCGLSGAEKFFLIYRFLFGFCLGFLQEIADRCIRKERFCWVLPGAE